MIIPTVWAFDLGGDLTAKDYLKFSTLIKYDVHREHNDDEPTAVDKDRTLQLWFRKYSSF